MFGTVFILLILPNSIVVLGSIECLNITINIHSLVLLSNQSQLPESIKNMCCNELDTRQWRHFSILFQKLLLSKLYCAEQFFLPLSFHFSQYLHNAIYIIEMSL
jgi:hypothetical protein